MQSIYQKINLVLQKAAVLAIAGAVAGLGVVNVQSVVKESSAVHQPLMVGKIEGISVNTESGQVKAAETTAPVTTKIVYIEGPAGPPGPVGPQGPKGDPGTPVPPNASPAYIFTPAPIPNYTPAPSAPVPAPVTLFSATDLSTSTFNTTTENVTNITVTQTLTTPSATFSGTDVSVTGALSVTGAATVTGTSTLHGAVTAADTAGVAFTAGNATGATILNGATVRFYGNTSVMGSNPFTVAAGLTTLGGNLTLNNATPILDTPNGTLQINTTTNKPVVFGTGNVGIGTTTPGQKLDVNGNVNISGFMQAGGALATASSGSLSLKIGRFDSIPSNATDAFIGTENSGGPGGLAGDLILMPRSTTGVANAIRLFTGQTTPVEHLTVDTSGNVGIGTANPSQLLDVSRSTIGDSVININAISGNAAGVRFQKAGVSYWEAGRGITDGLNDYQIYDFQGTAGARVTVQSSTGNVGIGTANPGALLHVDAGAGRSTTVEIGHFTEPATAHASILNLGTGSNNYNWQISAQNINSNALDFTPSTAIGGSTFTTPLLTLNIVSAPQVLLAPTSGNVGIGTTNPTSKLTVSGDIRIASGSGGQLIFADGSTMSAAGLGSAAALSNTVDAIVTGDSDANASGDVILKTASNDRLHILNGGNIGIGNPSPGYQLEVINNIGITASEAAGTNPTLVIRDNSAGQGRASAVNFVNSAGAANGQIKYVQSANTMSFFTNATQQMTILSSGNVGIGTTSPVDVLHVLKAQNAITNIQVQNTTPGTAAQAAFLAKSDTTNLYVGAHSSLFSSRPNAGFVDVQTNNDLDLLTNDTVRVTIQNTGNVGIGTTNPGATLHVKGPGTGSILAVASFMDSSVNQNALGVRTATGRVDLLATFGGTGVNTDLTFTPTTSGGAQNEAMRIQASTGNVGIGTTNPGVKLDVNGNIRAGITTGGVLTLGGAPTGNSWSSIGLVGSNTVTNWLIAQNDTTAGAFEILPSTAPGGSTFTTPAFIISNTNNIGIGTTTPGAKLDVAGQGTFSSGIAVTGGAGAAGTMTFNGAYGLLMQGKTAATGDSAVFTPAGSIVWYNPTGTQNVAFAGSVGIGNTSPSYALDVNGTIRRSASDGNVTTPATGLFMQNLNGTNANVASPAILFDAGWGGAQSQIYSRKNAGNSGAGGNLVFETQNSSATMLERMRIDSSGNVGIGTSNPGVALDISAVSAVRLRLNATGGTTGLQNFITMENGGTDYWHVGLNAAGIVSDNSYILDSAGVGVVATFKTNRTIQLNGYGAGTLTTDASGNVTASSDERLKNIQGPFSDGLSAVLGLNPIIYKWNDSSGLDQTTAYAGFSAQNVQQYIPEAVNTDPRGYLTLQDRPIEAALVNAVKELNDKISNLNQSGVTTLTELKVISKLYVSGDTAGEAKIIAGATSVRVSFSGNYEYQPIVTATPTDFVTGAYRVTNIDAGGFTIEMISAQASNVTFDWHAFAGESAKLTVSDGSTEDIILIAPGTYTISAPAATTTTTAPAADTTTTSTATPPVTPTDTTTTTATTTTTDMTTATTTTAAPTTTTTTATAPTDTTTTTAPTGTTSTTTSTTTAPATTAP